MFSKTKLFLLVLVGIIAGLAIGALLALKETSPRPYPSIKQTGNFSNSLSDDSDSLLPPLEYVEARAQAMRAIREAVIRGEYPQD